MSVTPEQAQKLTDLRTKILENVQKGLSPNEGLTKEDIREALSYLRQNRSAAQAAGAAKAKGKKAKAAKPTVVVSEDAFKNFTDMDLD